MKDNHLDPLEPGLRQPEALTPRPSAGRRAGVNERGHADAA